MEIWGKTQNNEMFGFVTDGHAYS